MAGIRMTEQSGRTVLHQNIWVDPDEVPVIFIMVKDGAVALAHPEYIADLLLQVDNGDLEPHLAWSFLMVKTPRMAVPQPCLVRRLANTGGAAEIVVDGKIVHKII